MVADGPTRHDDGARQAGSDGDGDRRAKPFGADELRPALTSLQGGLALVVSLAFLACVGLSGFLIDRLMSEEFRDAIIAEQNSLLAAHGEATAGKLRVALDALDRVSGQVTATMLAAPAQLQEVLSDNAALGAIFTHGMAVISLDGRVLAENPPSLLPLGRLTPRADLLPTPGQARANYILEPLAASMTVSEPTVSIGVWVRGANAAPVARLHGTISLLGENWLASVGRHRFSKAGYISVVTRNGTVIAHRDPARILGPVSPARVNPLLNRAVAGFEGSGETQTSSGATVLSTYRSVPGSDWILIASEPVDEAFAPLHRARLGLFVILASGTSIVLAITWLLTFRQLGPLTRLAQAIGRLDERRGGLAPVPVHGAEEVRGLARAYNALVEALAANQRAERATQAKYATAFRDNIDGTLILRLADGAVLEANDAAATLLGWSVAELAGDIAIARGIWAEPGERAELIRRVTGAGLVRDLPVDLATRGGERRACRISATLVELDEGPCAICVVRDLSDIREAERRILELNRERDAHLQRLRAITDNLPVWICYCDQNRLLRFINRTGAEWLAAPPEKLLGRTVMEIIGPGSGAIAGWIDQVMQGRRVRYTNTLRYPDGRTRAVEVTYVPDIDEATRSVRGYYSLVSDVTARTAPV